jgi:hypothetical protein
MSFGPKRKVIRKSASDIKSSATARPGQLPHKTHMRLVCLEMERYRRAQERDNLLARAARCEERCAAIDVEVHQLMERLAQMRPRPLLDVEPKVLPMLGSPRRSPIVDEQDLGNMLHSY